MASDKLDRRLAAILAVASYERLPIIHYWIHRNLAACHGQLGHIDKARSHWARVLEAVPDAKASRDFATIYATDPAIKDHWYEGLTKAGLTD